MTIKHTFVSAIGDGADVTLVRPSDWNADHAITGGGLLPSGCIVMWAGTIANIPNGFVICDGNNSTPNLLAKFVEGVATAATDPGATGGAVNKTTAGHTHTNPITSGPSAGSNGDPTTGAGIYSVYTAHKHTQGDTGSQTDTIADIRPPYYDIAFIMKT